MKPNREKKVQVSVRFPDRNLARPILERWGHDGSLSLNILRGRVTSVEACYDLEVRGSAPDVDRFLRAGVRWAASLDEVAAGVA